MIILPWPHPAYCKHLSSAGPATENTSSPNPLSPARRSWAPIRGSARRISSRARRGTLPMERMDWFQGKIARENSIMDVMGKLRWKILFRFSQDFPIHWGWENLVLSGPPCNKPCLYPGPLPPAVPLRRRDGIQVLPLQVRPRRRRMLRYMVWMGITWEMMITHGVIHR